MGEMGLMYGGCIGASAEQGAPVALCQHVRLPSTRSASSSLCACLACVPQYVCVCVCVCVCVRVYVYLYTYMHTYIHTYMHTCIHAYIHT